MCQWRQLTSGLFDGVLNRGYWVIPRLNLHMLCTFLYPIRHVGKRVFRARTYLNVPPKTSLTIPSYNPWMYLHSNGETQPENLRRSLKRKIRPDPRDFRERFESWRFDLGCNSTAYAIPPKGFT